MIEVEQKYELKPESRERLLVGANLVKTRVMHDIYYDTADVRLLGNETFLRNRDGRFEFKLPLYRPAKQLPTTFQFQEYEDEVQIRKVMNLPVEGPLPVVLEQAGYRPIAEYSTTRTTYRRGPFILDFDETDFGYGVLEIERQVEHDSERAAAAQSILDFAEQIGLERKHMRGKLHEYLIRKHPDVWALVQAAWATWPEK